MTNSTNMKIRENIKTYRLTQNLSQERLGEIVGVSPDYISLIERGKRLPSLKRLFLIAQALKVEPFKLLM